MRGSKALPLPKELPGTFFVLEYERDYESYKLHIDDRDRSSYDLGGDVQELMRQFERWGHEELGMNCIDLAHSFGAVQGIFSDGRTIPLFNRKPDMASVLEFQEAQSGRSLPTLRSS